MNLRIKVKSERALGIFLVLIPFITSYFFAIPNYNYFTTTGDVVHVNELGINGHVYITYVRSGYTKNLYEKYSLMWNHRPNIEFYQADQSEAEGQKEELDYEAEMRNDTIGNAVDAASKKVSNPTSAANANKMNEIINKSEKYYGNSLGLMVAIALTEEWGNEDFSKNMRLKIAGTGTMRKDMNVGAVGGIRYKVITAEQKGMHYFFVPASSTKSIETGLSNKEEALQVARERNMKIQIVPVATLDEAVQYLRSLP